MRKHRVRVLLMGGQACVLYGAAEFSRDVDFVILTDSANLLRLNKALAELQVRPIAVPPFALKFLRRGHAIHFRCQHPEALNVRVDVMAKLRGVDGFSRLWERRTTLKTPDGQQYDLLSLPDLVKAKKTQRDKDWPMIRRLVEANFFENRQQPTPAQVRFWLTELRTPELLVEVVQKHPAAAKKLSSKRPLLQFVLVAELPKLEKALADEEAGERKDDRDYWLPLRKELEQLRHQRR